jgi:hypothetical protein
MSSQPPTQLHVEFSLVFLIERSEIVAGGPDRRLNAIENLLMLLSRKWRGAQPIRPRQELRMATDTRDQFIVWVSATGAVDGHTRGRLDLYRGNGLILEDVPSGLLRILLR